jgi:hypothetical protein
MQEETKMSAYQTRTMYETNRMSDFDADTLITSEKDRPRVDPPTTCPACARDVKMITAEKAAAVCQCSRRKIYRWIEDGSLHYFEKPGGEVLVCGRSLFGKMDGLDSFTDRLSG